MPPPLSSGGGGGGGMGGGPGTAENICVTRRCGTTRANRGERGATAAAPRPLPSPVVVRAPPTRWQSGTYYRDERSLCAAWRARPCFPSRSDRRRQRPLPRLSPPPPLPTNRLLRLRGACCSGGGTSGSQVASLTSPGDHMAGKPFTMTSSQTSAYGGSVHARLGPSGGAASGKGGGEGIRTTRRQARQTRQAALAACGDSAAPWHRGATAVRRGHQAVDATTRAGDKNGELGGSGGQIMKEKHHGQRPVGWHARRATECLVKEKTASETCTDRRKKLCQQRTGDHKSVRRRWRGMSGMEQQITLKHSHRQSRPCLITVDQATVFRSTCCDRSLVVEDIFCPNIYLTVVKTKLCCAVRP